MSAPLALTDWRRVARAAPSPLVLVCALAVIGASYVWLPNGGLDWSHDIGPSVRAWFPAPWLKGLPLLPWAALLLSPLGALPDRVATALVNGASVIALAVTIRKMGGRDWMAIPLLVSPFGIYMFGNGQTDCLILAGVTLSGGLDLLIVILKPQVALGVMMPRLRRADRHWWAYLAPLAIVLGLSLLVWPGWPQGIAAYAPVLLPGWWNWSIWPWGVPVGLFLLWRAWRTGDDRLGVAATPLLSPYLTAPSYLGLLAALASRWPQLVLALWALFWASAGWYVLVTWTSGALATGYAAAVVLVASLGGLWYWRRYRQRQKQAATESH